MKFTQKFTNPILPGVHPDPSFCRVGEDYFLINSSFEYFPGVPLFHSRDLVNWKLVNYVLSRPSQLSFEPWQASGGIFAPTIRHHDGTFYMVTTNLSGGGNFVVHTQDPFGEWSDPVWLDQPGIDPSLHFDADGKVYLTTSWLEHWPPPAEIDLHHPPYGILQSEIDLKSGQRLSEGQVIWRGTGGRYPEGPHLFKKGGFYYLLIAEGGTELGHMVTLARSESPWGPWEACPHNPVLTHRSMHSPFQALGHADLLEAHDGSWWLVCLGIRPQGFPPAAQLGRETLLAPVRWDEQGWPHVGLDSPVQIRTEMEGPSFYQSAQTSFGWRDEFQGPQLNLRWNYLGQPQGEHYRLGEDGLLLEGTTASLQDGPPVTFLGCRQESLSCTLQTELNFQPAREGEEAGLSVWMNPQHHYDLVITLRAGGRWLVTRRQVGSLGAETGSVALPDGPVTLWVEADPTTYRLGMVNEQGEKQILDQAEARYLAPEVAGGFTGVYFAFFATGNGQPSTTPLRVSWAEMTPAEGP